MPLLSRRRSPARSRHPTPRRNGIPSALALLLLAAPFPPGASAQEVRPGDVRPELPSFEPPRHEPGTILPPLRLPRPGPPDTEALARGRRVFLRAVRVTGNTVLSDPEIARVTGPYLDRESSFADLQELRDALTLAYIDRGYVTSGAVIPEQTVADGVLEIRIVEGTLASVEVETDGRLRESYVRTRLERGMAGAVNVGALEERLQILQQDERIRSIRAELLPGDLRGESSLRVHVAEERPYRAVLELSNHQSPTIGAERARIDLAHVDVTGFGDSFSASFGITEGLRQVEARYQVPLNRYDTTFDLHLSRAWSEVVEDPFDDLDIESRSETYGFTLRQPAYRSLRSQLSLFVGGEWRRSKSLLLGSGFPFSEGVSEEGVSKVSVLRFGQDWTYRDRSQVFALRSVLSAGIDVLGATTHTGDVPDGKFVAWLGQVQWVRRLGLLDSQVIVRADLQLAESPLLGLEQFAVGGHSTVRGYRENQLVRDNGVIGSIEFRIPVLTRSTGAPILELAPFADVGHSWNRGRPSLGPDTPVGVGVGLRLSITERIRLEAYWAEDLVAFPEEGETDLQDRGLHLRLRASFP